MNASQFENGEEATVFVIIGRAFERKGDEPTDIHILLSAPDDDSAVREALNALAQEGYEEAELDQIGVLDGMPDEEPYASAFQGAMEGEVAIITM
ncbi:MAG: transcriptional regulator [Hyphomicrobiales bacterium]|nr:transcriptional regulator [Hyphomicrobiales bacterium]